MDTPTLVQNDVTRCIFAHQALSKQKIKRGPGDEAIYIQGLLEVKGGGWSFKRYLGTVMPKWNEQKNGTPYHF